jgi:hypothetical protein
MKAETATAQTKAYESALDSKKCRYCAEIIKREASSRTRRIPVLRAPAHRSAGRFTVFTKRSQIWMKNSELTLAPKLPPLTAIGGRNGDTRSEELRAAPIAVRTLR